MGRRALLSLLGTLLVLVSALPAGSAAASTETDTDGPTRILIVGDSITQGSTKTSASGGYSWRYFLWKRFAPGSADFVGNKTGPTFCLTANCQSPSLYADPDFDYDHAGVAGARLGETDPAVGHYPIGSLVQTYQPDVIVALWGTNNLRGHTTPEHVITLYKFWLAQARAQNPDVDIVIGRLPWTWITPQVSRFNALLTTFAAAYSTERSPIVLAAMADDYGPQDTYDNLHPVRSGEEKIAAMMGSALRALGLPVDAPPILPGNVFAPVRAPAAPNLVLSRRAGKMEVLARWNARARASGYTLRCNGVDQDFLANQTSVTMRDSRALSCRVRASNYAGPSAWSPAVTVARR